MRLPSGLKVGSQILQGRLVHQPRRAALRVQGVELREPPVVLARAVRRGQGKAAAVGAPVVFVDEEVGGGERPQGRAAVGGHERKALLLDLFQHHAGLPRGGHQGPPLVGAAGDVEHREGLAVGAEARLLEVAGDAGELADLAGAQVRHVELRLVRADRIGEEGQGLSVRAEGGLVLVVRLAVAARADLPRLRGAEVLHVEQRLVGRRAVGRLHLLHPRHAPAVAREGDGAHRDGGLQRTENVDGGNRGQKREDEDHRPSLRQSTRLESKSRVRGSRVRTRKRPRRPRRSRRVKRLQ